MVEGAGLEVPDLVGMVEQPVAHELVLPRQQPDQVHLFLDTKNSRSNHTPFSTTQRRNHYSNCRSAGQSPPQETYLVLLLEAEGSGEEGGGTGVRAHVGDAPRLEEGKKKMRRRRKRGATGECSRSFEKVMLLAWYLRPP